MSSIVFLICVLIQFVRPDCDETPAVVDPKYGENTYCHFSYFSGVDPHLMKDTSPLAKMFGPGQLKGYTVAFADLTDWFLDTLVEDSNEVACGMAYLLPVSEFQKILRDTFDSHNRKYRNLITVSVDVTKDGKHISMKCNAFQTIKQPMGNEVACKDDLQLGIDAYKAAHLPEECIAKLQEIPSQDC